MELVHLEPVEDAARDGLDQVARLLLRLLDRVAAHEGGAVDHGVVELPRGDAIRAGSADESARLEPLAPEHGILRARDRDDDVHLGCVLQVLARLGVEALAELLESLLVPGVGHGSLELRQCRSHTEHLAFGLPARADHAE